MRIYRIDRDSREQFTGPQGQKLRVMLNRELVPSAEFSILDVWMPPGAISSMHVHEESPIAIRVLDGYAATLALREGAIEVVLHDAHSVVYVDPGVPHCAVNLDDHKPVVGIEVRTDPLGSADTRLTPEWDDAAQRIALDAQSRFRNRLIDLRVSGRAPWPTGGF